MITENIDNPIPINNIIFLRFCSLISFCFISSSVCWVSADGEPDDGEPGDGEPDDGEPDDGEPDDGEPDDGEPGDIFVEGTVAFIILDKISLIIFLILS